jgi:hypothetical protein
MSDYPFRWHWRARLLGGRGGKARIRRAHRRRMRAMARDIIRRVFAPPPGMEGGKDG